MEITREQVIKRVAEKANYWQKDVKNVFEHFFIRARFKVCM